nr:c-type cytochrome biogenesis protein CcmF [Burkholderiales bacterium]
TLVKGYETEKDVRMEVGDSVLAGGYNFRFMGAIEIAGPNFSALRGTIEVSDGGAGMTVMHPEKRFYPVQQSGMTEAAIDTGLFRDIYVSLGEPVGNGAWSVRIYHKPFVDWIWGGCLIMAIGGVLAASDRRYRLALRARSASGAPEMRIEPALVNEGALTEPRLAKR